MDLSLAMAKFGVIILENIEMPPSNAKGRVAILNQISDWLKLLALIVLTGEVLLTVTYRSTKQDDPMRPYFFPLMIGLLAFIVVGVFFDRWASRGDARPRDGGARTGIALATRWNFKSGTTQEELHLDVQGNAVSGLRRTIHARGNVTEYVVSGWRHGSTFWLEYHLMIGNGGGVILLDEFTNDRYSGMLLSKDCDTGVKQCRTNVWFTSHLIKNHKQDYFMFVGAITPSPIDGFVVQSTEEFKRT
jgi:hypothetical protein